jgi:ESS family glutamate:Na+ symporter
MNFSWGLFVDLGLVSMALLAATAIRHRFRFFQRYLIPNALTAGFLLLPFYNYVGPLIGISSEMLGQMVYHLLSISFISMTLRATAPQASGGDGRIFATSIATLWQFGVQALVGLLFTLLMMVTVMPDLFPSFGFLLPLGFVQGPGQAYAIGNGWARFGFESAGSIGLTFAAMGFVFASFGGVFLINIGIRRGWLTEEFLRGLDTSAVKSGIFPSRKRRPVGAEMTTESEAIDSFTFHIAMVLGVHLLSYVLLFGITSGLSTLGPLFADLAENLWGNQLHLLRSHRHSGPDGDATHRPRFCRGQQDPDADIRLLRRLHGCCCDRGDIDRSRSRVPAPDHRPFPDRRGARPGSRPVVLLTHLCGPPVSSDNDDLRRLHRDASDGAGAPAGD